LTADGKMGYTSTVQKSIDEYEAELRQKLKDDPSLLLPFADSITIAPEKYTKYLFGGDIESGLNKGRTIDRVLGYNINNYQEFDAKVKQAVKEFPAYKIESLDFMDGDIHVYGDTYELITVIKGLKNRKAAVTVAAFVDPATSKVTSIYIEEIKEVK
jgi:hypothetical protein